MFEENEVIDEQNKTTGTSTIIDRTDDLIATFVDGYAQGWSFAVGECFKDQLDIKLTPRMDDMIDEHGEKVEVEKKDRDGKIIYNEDGTPKMKAKRISVMEWTQGQYFCFSEGHIIYDTPKAYLQWDKALEHIQIQCEVLRSVANNIDDKYANKWSKLKKRKDGNWWAIIRDSDPLEYTRIGESLKDYIHGSVTFKLSKPNKDKTNLEIIGQYHRSQFEFVDFLKTGKLDSDIDIASIPW